jgi:hypothetical protein
MYLQRNKETGIVESFDDNGNKIGEVITMGDMVKKGEKENSKK